VDVEAGPAEAGQAVMPGALEAGRVVMPGAPEAEGPELPGKPKLTVDRKSTERPQQTAADYRPTRPFL
jgi:hypothetical protein